MTRGAIIAGALAHHAGSAPARGSDLVAVHLDGPAGIAWEDGRIVFAGPADDLPWAPDAGDPHAGMIVPGFVDPHVHLPFIGWRADEFDARLRGVTYRDQHGAEGGIFRSARALREAGDDEVLHFSAHVLDEMAASGTTAVELKTGYGLSVDGELRQARLARRLASVAAQTCRVTLLACHAVPPETKRAAWVRTACEELIPVAAAQGLLDQVDIYVEDIAFDLDDLARVAEATARAGLPLRVHADQLGPSEAAEAAVALGARSADHLNHCGEEGVVALGGAPATAAVLLPASTLFLGAPVPPVGPLRDAGAIVTLATDMNPGTSPVSSMPEVIAIACALYRLPPLEALTAATTNGAWVLGLHEDLGSLTPGARADLLLLDVPTFAHVPYRAGRNPVVATYMGGELVAGDPARVRVGTSRRFTST